MTTDNREREIEARGEEARHMLTLLEMRVMSADFVDYDVKSLPVADKVREYMDALEARVRELTRERDAAREALVFQERITKNVHAAVELQSDLLANALGKTTREGLSYMDLVAEVKPSMDQRWTEIKAVLMTFEYTRRAYLLSVEWYTVENLWRMGLLSAGMRGEDDAGKYQAFTITDRGLAYLDKQAGDSAALAGNGER